MATYLSLLKFTPQGAKNIKASIKRADAFKKAVADKGGKVRDLFWTLGRYDGAVVFEAKNDESAAAIMIAVARLGNVQPETLRAFTAKEFAKVAKKS